MTINGKTMGKPVENSGNLDDVPVPWPGEDLTGNWDFNFDQTRGPPPAETNLDFWGLRLGLLHHQKLGCNRSNYGDKGPLTK